LGAFFFLLLALANLTTTENAFLAGVIVPFLPYEVDFFTAAIPAFTAWLNLEDRFFLVWVGKTAAEKERPPE
jgi:hypothetical protein